VRNPHYPYRPDIDGLRAVAVICVIAYHAFPASAPGGFVGVDVFFVISGFLITGILQREIADSTFSVSGFYARRAKRLFPALAVVLATTVIIGWALLVEDEYRQLGKHVAAGVAFVSNIALWRETGYFDVASESKPLLHLWSLGVEEQFYIVWPLIIALTFRARLNFFTAAGTLGLLSFAASIVLVDSKPASAFFLPHPRFWELMIGGLLAAADPIFTGSSTSGEGFALAGRRFATLREAAALVGLVLIGLSVAIIDEKSSFPGWWVLLPTLGSCLLIGGGPRTWVSRRLMSRRALVSIGLISYPLYLWHWPLLSFARIVYADQPPVGARLAVLVATALLAWGTYRYVETPIRVLARGARCSRVVVAGLGAVMSTLFVTGLMVRHGVPQERLKDLSVIVSKARKDWHYPGDDLAAIDGVSGEAVLFFGDSLVRQLYPRIKHVAALNPRARRAVIFNTAPGCAPLRGIGRKSRSECLAYSARGFEIAASPAVRVVVIGGSWLGMLKRGDYYDAEDPKERVLDLEEDQNLSLVLGRLEQQLRLLRSLGKETYVVLNPPGGRLADPGAIEGARLSTAGRLKEKSIPFADHRVRTGVINERISAVAQRAGAAVIDPAGWLCSDERCALADPEGIPYFRDATHLRASFVRCCVRDFDQLVVIENQ